MGGSEIMVALYWMLNGMHWDSCKASTLKNRVWFDVDGRHVLSSAWDGWTGIMSDTNPVLIPSSSSRDTRNEVPATRGRKDTVTDVVLSVTFATGMDNGGELSGRITTEEGGLVEKNLFPPFVLFRKVSVTGAHCLTSLSLKLNQARARGDL